MILITGAEHTGIEEVVRILNLVSMVVMDMQCYLQMLNRLILMVLVVLLNTQMF